MSVNTTGRDDVTEAVAKGGPPKPLTLAGPKQRRRPALLALMVGLVALGGLLGAYAFTAVSDTREVLALTRDVARGEQIEASDLQAVQVGTDPALELVPASQRPWIVGRRANINLASGTLLTEASTGQALVPTKGDSLVGISLTSAQMPAEPLVAGDVVRIVSTPGDQGDVAEAELVTFDAVVVGVSRSDDLGVNLVDVTVPQSQASELAARAATGKVALVLDSRER